jgi:hypothetical protein
VLFTCCTQASALPKHDSAKMVVTDRPELHCGGHVRHSAPIPPGKANSLPLRPFADFRVHDSPLDRVTGPVRLLPRRSVPVGMEFWRCQRPSSETSQSASSVYFRLHRPWCTPGPASPYQHRPSERLGFTIFRNRRRRSRCDLNPAFGGQACGQNLCRRGSVRGFISDHIVLVISSKVPRAEGRAANGHKIGQLPSAGVPRICWRRPV